MKPVSRQDRFQALFPGEPPFRWKQIEQALFQEGKNGWADISTLSKAMRETLEKEVPWISVVEDRVFESKRGDTYKAILKTCDDLRFETVLMENKRGQWSICVSSQIGCAMQCTFCATGAMGLKRSMTADEIMDQYRSWKAFLAARPDLPQRISNVVFMGMGEPLANYDAVKKAIHTWLRHTDLGPTHITVSTVGVLFQMEKILEDPDWPPVRIAVSLHSADQKRREEIVPTTTPGFIDTLAAWSRKYEQTLGNRRHHITFEYTLLSGVNDTPAHAEELARFVQKTGASKINVIPYNPVSGKPFARSALDRIDQFKSIVRRYGLDITQRRTMGDDIAAACGQLITEEKAGTIPRSLSLDT